MRPTSLRSERLILADPADVRLQRNIGYSDRIVAALTSHEAISIGIFCLLGLLLTAVLNFLVPNFGVVTASLQPLF